MVHCVSALPVSSAARSMSCRCASVGRMSSRDVFCFDTVCFVSVAIELLHGKSVQIKFSSGGVKRGHIITYCKLFMV